MIELRELFVTHDSAVSTLLDQVLDTTDADCISGEWSPGTAKHAILTKLGFRRSFGRIHLALKILKPETLSTIFQPDGWDVTSSEFMWN